MRELGLTFVGSRIYRLFEPCVDVDQCQQKWLWVVPAGVVNLEVAWGTPSS